MFWLWNRLAGPLTLMIYDSRHLRLKLLRGSSICCLLLLLSTQVWGARSADFSPSLTNVAQVRALARGWPDSRPVAHLRAVVTYFDTRWNLFVVQDETGGILVRTLDPGLPLARGQEVDLEGEVTPTPTGMVLEKPVVRAVRDGQLPPVVTATVAAVLNGQHEAMRVEVRGVVRSLEFERRRTILHLHDGSGELEVFLRDVTPGELSPEAWVDAEVVVQGIPRCIVGTARESRVTQFMATGLENVDVKRLAPEKPFSVSAIPVAVALQTNSAHGVKVMGRATAAPETNGWLTIEDTTGAIRLRHTGSGPVLMDDLVEVLGYPAGPPAARFLDHARLRVLANGSRYQSAFTNDVTLPPPPHLPVLFQIAEVRALSADKAGLGYPVRVRGVVTFQDPVENYLFIHDGAQGICITPELNPGPLPPGEIIEVTGYSHAGLYAPTVVHGKLLRVARGDLPVPHEVNFTEMMTGREDCQWVTVEGIVRDASIYQKQIWIKLAVNGGIVSAMVPVPESPDSLAHLIDAEIRLRAVCGANVNQRRQIISSRLFVPGMEFITVKAAPPRDPFALPVTQISDLFRFNPDGTPGHRVRLAGVVTFASSSRQFFLRDATSGALIDLASPLPLAAGDLVEVCAFPFRADPAPHLKFALARKLGSGSRPAPVDLDARGALNGGHDADLVRLQARLLEVSATGNNAVLVLNDRNLVFEATGDTNLLTAFRALQPGSLLQLTGICSVPNEESGTRRTLRLLVASAADVVVLQSPPGPTLERALQLLALLGAIILVVALWGLTLRRRVRSQTEEIRQINADLEARVVRRTAELEASNKELEAFSYSVSHDLRAPLRAINGFAEILLKETNGSLNDKARHYLGTVASSGRRMGELVDDLLSFSRLNRQPMSTNVIDLNALVRQQFDELRRAEPQRVVAVEVQPLPSTTGDRNLVNQVLTNLLGNAWKFTEKKPEARIEVGAQSQNGETVYYVRDNGAGFNMAYADKLFGVFQRLHSEEEFSGTGVGLAIVQRVIQRHGGRVWAESREHEGATFYFTLPAACATKMA